MTLLSESSNFQQSAPPRRPRAGQARSEVHQLVFVVCVIVCVVLSIMLFMPREQDEHNQTCTNHACFFSSFRCYHLSADIVVCLPREQDEHNDRLS